MAKYYMSIETIVRYLPTKLIQRPANTQYPYHDPRFAYPSNLRIQITLYLLYGFYRMGVKNHELPYHATFLCRGNFRLNMPKSLSPYMPQADSLINRLQRQAVPQYKDAHPHVPASFLKDFVDPIINVVNKMDDHNLIEYIYKTKAIGDANDNQTSLIKLQDIDFDFNQLNQQFKKLKRR